MAVENSNAGEDSGSSASQAFEQLMAEQEGVIPPGFAERIEKDLQYNLGITRRLALVYLEKPFKETVATIERDREFAVATAHVAHVLGDHLESYRMLVKWLEIARARMGLSLAIREDMEAVVAEAKADSDAACAAARHGRLLQ